MMGSLDETVEFRCHTEWRDGASVIVIAGEVDLHTAPELDRALHECEAQRPTQVVVDLMNSTLLDSTGIAILVAARKRLQARYIPLKLVCTSLVIRRVLTITGVDRMLPIHESRETALSNGKGTRQVDPGESGLDAQTAPGATSES